MKGQILETLQSTCPSFFPSSNYKPLIWLARTNLPSYGRFLCPLLLLICFLSEHNLPAAQLANVLSQDAIIALSQLVSDENLLLVTPSSTNSAQQSPPVGPTNIIGLEDILRLYADSTGRIVLWPRNLPMRTFKFTADKPLTSPQTRSALDTFFALNGIVLVDVGEKWVQAFSSAGCQTSADSTHETSDVTHVQHLTYVKPSEMVPVLLPFSTPDRSRRANPVLPIDSQQILVLRDLPQNVEKMRAVIREVDVAPPAEFISEVIPVKYAKASEIAPALNKSAPLEPKAKHRPAAENFVELGQHKIIADERTNSLLAYAGREDMKRIKEIISQLDIAAAQILIEAVIIEVNRENDREFSAIDNEKVPWMTNFASILPTNAIPSANSAPEAGFYRLAMITNDLDSFVTTLATNNSAKILQRPRIQTSDGEPAQLFVGESRPYGCGSSIQAINLGVTLELTPSITNDQLITLDIHQTIEQADGSVTIANVGDIPISRRSERNAKIAVRDGDIVLLDGSIERENSTHPGKFQDELIILIHPKILPPPEVAQLSRAEKDKMPAVRRAETEIQSEEANRLKQLDENLKRDRDLSRE